MSEILVGPRRLFLKKLAGVAAALVAGCIPFFNKLHTTQELQQKLDSMFGFRVYAISIGGPLHPQLGLSGEVATKLSRRTRVADLTPIEVDLLYQCLF